MLPFPRVWRQRMAPFVPLTLLVLVASMLPVGVLAGAATDSGFEGSDGNLAPAPAPATTVDWNTFAPITWPNAAPNTAPYRDSTPKTVGGWHLAAFEDAANSSTDTVFAGGTKQDADCATVQAGPKPPNKDDLERISVAHATKAVGGADHVFLALAWVRIPQNSTSASAHVAFEFNQGNAGPCPTSTIPGNDGLVRRSLANGGDMLIVYDFEGSSTDNPTLKLLRWRNTGTCEASGKATPATGCWVFQADLTGGGSAEAKVNTSDVGSVTDLLTPPAPPATTSVSETLGNNEFGEAIVDLTAAGVFPATPTACLSFGRVFGVSRSSGNSAQAQMKDLVGPGDVSISNCGTVIVRKTTSPAGGTGFGFTKSFTTAPATGGTFSLDDGGSRTFSNVLFGSGYTVDETSLPAGWQFDSVDCSASSGVTPSITGSLVTFAIDDPADVLDCTYHNVAKGTIIVEKVSDAAGTFNFTSETLPETSFSLTTTGAGTDGKASRTFSDLSAGTYDVAETVPDGWNLTSASCSDGSDPGEIELDPGETVTCTFENVRQRGAIEITKTRKYASATSGDPNSQPQANVTFTITGGELAAAGVTVETGADGTACLDGLVLSSFVGDYTVTETVPEGYVADGDTAKTVSVTAEASCGDGNEATVAFSNTPLTDLSITVTSQDPGATKSTIVCELDGEAVGDSGTAADPAPLDLTDLEPGTYTCTVVIDP